MSTWQNTKLTHLVFELDTPEEVDYDLVETLKSMIDKCTLDSDSSITGTMNTDYAFKDSVDSLMSRFSGLTINYTNRLLRLSGNTPLKTYLLSIGDSNKDGVLGEDEVGGITSMTVASDVVNFNDDADGYDNILSLCTGLETLSGGTGLEGDIDVSSNSNITSIDMSSSGTENILGLSNKSKLTGVKYNAPTEIIINNCENLIINNIISD